MDTILDFRSFDARFKSGLLFSIYEGLLQGKLIKVIFDQDPEPVRKQFEEAKFSGAEWVSNKISDSLWEVCITKNNIQKNHTCCGVCGNG